MKLITIILLIIAINSVAQDKSYLQLRKEYAKYCNQILTDTVTETGIIRYEISPKNGDIKLIPKDTIWNEVKCKEYKYVHLDYISFGNSHDFFVTTSTVNNYSIPSKTTFETEITREKYCKVKRQPQSESDFFEWVQKVFIKE